MAETRTGQTKGVAPYTKYDKTPYQYPAWCKAEKGTGKFPPKPQWLEQSIERAHREHREAEAKRALAAAQKAKQRPLRKQAA